MVPTVVENSMYLFVNIFLETLLLWLWLKYNIAAQPYYYWWTQACRIKTMVLRFQLIIVWKEGALLPAMFNPAQINSY